MHTRRHERQVVDYEVKCFLQGCEERLFIYDICVDGCCIDTDGFRVEIDEKLYFKFLDSIGVEGKVVWKNDRYAGVQFLEELHPALILHLGFQVSGTTMGEFQPRDRFGRELPPMSWAARLLQS